MAADGGTGPATTHGIRNSPATTRYSASPRRETSGSLSQSRDTGRDREEVLRLSTEYDRTYPRSTQQEKALGHHIKREKEVGRAVLQELIEWKFATLPGRIKRTRNLINSHSDTCIPSITRQALARPMNQEDKRIQELRRIKGVGISLASVILTFSDPENYCIYDTHVMREQYGTEPTNMFASSKHYIRLLNDLRAQSKTLKLPVRTIEKALFKKNSGSLTPIQDASVNSSMR